MFIIDGKGQLFEIQKRDKDGRVVVEDRMQTKLRDNSTLKKVINIWQTHNVHDNYGRINLIEAITSDDLTVICSASDVKPDPKNKKKEANKRLGRSVCEDEKEGDFHILDYEPDLTSFKQVSCSDHAITAVDQDGEVWILCGNQTY